MAFRSRRSRSRWMRASPSAAASRAAARGARRAWRRAGRSRSRTRDLTSWPCRCAGLDVAERRQVAQGGRQLIPRDPQLEVAGRLSPVELFDRSTKPSWRSVTCKIRSATGWKSSAGAASVSWRSARCGGRSPGRCPAARGGSVEPLERGRRLTGGAASPADSGEGSTSVVARRRRAPSRPGRRRRSPGRRSPVPRRRWPVPAGPERRAQRRGPRGRAAPAAGCAAAVAPREAPGDPLVHLGANGGSGSAEALLAAAP